MKMKYAINLPNFGDYGNPHTLVDLAREAEQAGWDGFFLWDHIHLYQPPAVQSVTDPWIALAAIAAATSTIRLGPMVTPLARRRPWKVARETVAMDHLSGGRLIFGVGLGDPPGPEFAALGEDPDPTVRGRKLDEGLAVLSGLWTGKPFSFDGEFYRLSNVCFAPMPVQQPRIPVIVAGTWPNRKPLRRAARWDGVFPFIAGDFSVPTPEELRAIVACVREFRAPADPFEVFLAGATPGEDPGRAAAQVAAYADAGLTWWQEELTGRRGTLAAMRERIRQGPPRIEHG